jgi:hypothetical protein
MPIKFEEQFKHRDERNLKKTALGTGECSQKLAIYRVFRNLAGFGLPCRLAMP